MTVAERDQAEPPASLVGRTAVLDVLGAALDRAVGGSGGEAEEAGCTVETIRWNTPFESATHLWNVITSSHPIGAQLVADLTHQQAAQVRQLLDGMLRERSGGAPGAALHADINLGIGIGTK